MLRTDSKRGKSVAKLLYESFSTVGVLGRTDMPVDIVLKNVTRGSLEHVISVTLTVAINYQRDASALWESSMRTLEDEKTRYLFDPRALHETPPERIVEDMQKHGLSRKPQKDAYIWRTVGVTFHEKWDGDPRNFLQDCGWDAPTVLERLKSDSHPYGGQPKDDYPHLRGLKTGPLWLRVLRDNVGIELRNLDRVPIPVDRHIARATLATGVVRGRFRGRLRDLFEDIRAAWFESVKGLYARNSPMIALDVDKPLWHLSKYGCAQNRNEITGDCSVFHRCEARMFCVKGRIMLKRNFVELDT